MDIVLGSTLNTITWRTYVITKREEKSFTLTSHNFHISISIIILEKKMRDLQLLIWWYGSRSNPMANIISRGGHSIVKLKTMCNGKKSTFYIKDHQNKSIFFRFFSRVDIHSIYYIVKNCNQIQRFCFYIKHTVSN